MYICIYVYMYICIYVDLLLVALIIEVRFLDRCSPEASQELPKSTLGSSNPFYKTFHRVSMGFDIFQPFQIRAPWVA